MKARGRDRKSIIGEQRKTYGIKFSFVYFDIQIIY